MKKEHGNIEAKSNRDYSKILRQFCNEKNYSGVLLVDYGTYDNLLYKNETHIIAPIPQQLKYQDKIIVAPSVDEHNTTVALEYGSLFAVINMLDNQYGEIEELEPGFSVITINYLCQLTDDILNGKQEQLQFILPPPKNLQ
ncbi:hypothetical protein [Nitrosomonas communis]|uniref:Uncharacterized protein n=1 Tax=Nitrosomonas communis TaxID=44574 RepID=A0A1I4U8N9_9PROT|nr:hypothetical protein [Nitrosomonas communis]SFM85317.1 hypothetical protein SAMN05421863_106112 [Nitrosomonas communis]